MPLPDEAAAEAFAPQEGDPAEQHPVEPTAEEIAAEKAAQAAAAEQQRIAEFNAHPHTRLSDLQKQLTAPGNLDVNARIGMLHSVVSQLLQVIKQHTPAPETHDGEG